jgi:hypothetical protein
MVFTGPRILGWLALAIGAANTPATALGLGLTVVDRVLKRRRLWFVGALVVFLTAVYFDLHFRGYGITHNPYANNSNGGVHTVMPYSGGVGFSYPVFFGLISILLSFGKGLFFFAPGLLIPARRTLQGLSSAVSSAYRLWLVYLAGMVMIYAAWWAWYGGFTWGPRFFLLGSLPASLALATKLRFPPTHHLALLGVFAALVLSCWVGSNGIVWGDYAQDPCMANNFALEHLCWYAPEFSVLWRPFVISKTSFSAFEIAYLAYAFLTLLWLSRTLLRPLGIAIVAQSRNVLAPEASRD